MHFEREQAEVIDYWSKNWICQFQSSNVLKQKIKQGILEYVMYI